MSHIPSNQREWASAAALIRDATSLGRPLGPLGHAALLDAAITYVTVTEDGEPLAQRVLSALVDSLTATAALREEVKRAVEEVRDTHGPDMMRAVQAEWLAISERWGNPDDQEGLWRALFEALTRRLAGLGSTIPARREASILAALARSNQAQALATSTFDRFKAFCDRLEVTLAPLQTLYPPAAEALLRSGDEALRDALLIDFSTPDGQARHRALSRAAAEGAQGA